MSETVIKAGIQATVNQLVHRGACNRTVIRALRDIADEMVEQEVIE